MRFFEDGFLIKGNPEIRPNGNHTITRSAIHYIPWNQIDIIYENIDNGFGFRDMSPLFDLTRDQIAWLISNRNEMGRFR